MQYAKKGSNISKEGKSYRVRMTINGHRISKNFTKLKNAKEFLNNLKNNIA